MKKRVAKALFVVAVGLFVAALVDALMSIPSPPWAIGFFDYVILVMPR